MSASWTIQQLGDEVEARLADQEAPSNGQVRAVPDERSIRYYTTLGLLDRPVLRGRTALYGRRHLAQLVAIKRLQAEGKTLAEIQRHLPTLGDAELSRLSGVEVHAPRRPGRREFWRDGETSSPTLDAAPASTLADATSCPAAPAPGASLTPSLELALAPGVRLTFHAARTATDADAAALLAAAAPLLAELARRHLVSPPDPPASPQPSPEQPED